MQALVESRHLSNAGGWAANALLHNLTLRTIVASLFDHLKVAALRAELERLVGFLGAPLESCLVERVHATLHWGPHFSLLQLATDPDAEPIGEYSVGVRWRSILFSRECQRTTIAKRVGVAGFSMMLRRDPAFALEVIDAQGNYGCAA